MNHTDTPDGILPIQSDNQKLFEDDDDELFMNVDCEKFAESAKPQTKVRTKARVTTTFSKRIKYENSSSSDEDTSPTASKLKPKPSSVAQTSAQNSVQPVGIRKRNNMF